MIIMNKEIPLRILNKLKSVQAKRAKTLIEHIIKKGYITTEELKLKYGYAHPPRAARDVGEQGIPLKTIRIKGTDGRTIAAYEFEDFRKITRDKLGGRKIFPKQFKEQLHINSKCNCYICMEKYDERYLQIDHRIPYEVVGDSSPKNRDITDYMLLCGSCNRAKSWSCEHCENGSTKKNPNICRTCYWAYPQKYNHIAEKNLRRLDLVWLGEEVGDYDTILLESKKQFTFLPAYVKDVLKKHVHNNT